MSCGSQPRSMKSGAEPSNWPKYVHSGVGRCISRSISIASHHETWPRKPQYLSPNPHTSPACHRLTTILLTFDGRKHVAPSSRETSSSMRSSERRRRLCLTMCSISLQQPIREDGFISTGNATDSASVGVQANRKPSNLGGNEQVGMKLGFLE